VKRRKQVLRVSEGGDVQFPAAVERYRSCGLYCYGRVEFTSRLSRTELSRETTLSGQLHQRVHQRFQSTMLQGHMNQSNSAASYKAGYVAVSF